MAVNAHGTVQNACALGFASGEAVAKARGGATGQFSRAQAPAEKMSSARRPVHSSSNHATAAARPSASRRG
jgi:hypothetical protein